MYTAELYVVAQNMYVLGPENSNYILCNRQYHYIMFTGLHRWWKIGLGSYPIKLSTSIFLFLLLDTSDLASRGF